MIQIFQANKIYTMNAAQPTATHIAVSDGNIVAIGDIEDVKHLSNHVDTSFVDKVLLPGFVEAHSHATEGTFWRHTYCGFFDRADPDGRVWAGLKSVGEIVLRLKKIAAVASGSLTGWGIDPIYFQNTSFTRHDLDEVSREIPVGLVHASCHIVSVNSKALELLGLLRNGIIHPGIVLGDDGLPNGELRGPEAIALIGPSLGFDYDLLGCDADGLRKFARLCVRKGVTTASDFANPLSDNLVQTMLKTTAEPDYPIRLVSLLRSQELSGEALIQRAKVLKKLSTERLRLGSVKLVADGSIQGFTARLRSGRYFNGAPNGLWYVSKEDLLNAYVYALKYDIQIHAHTNGDQATELVIACIKEALQLSCHDNHRFVIQHCQLVDDDLLIKMKQLNVSGNFFINHVYYWGDQHAAYTVGPDRAAQMNPCASALRHGLQIAIHSDAPITPLDPLFTAWCATCRETVSGKILGPNECIKVSEALYAITMGAAYTLGLDHEVGSLEVGKRADFAVLEQDPFMRQASFLREVSVWGTVQSGRVFQAQRPT